MTRTDRYDGRVALESTVLSHGLPWPDNLQLARSLESIVRDRGAAPATIGYVHGRLATGLDPDEIERFCRGDEIRKVSVRDIPVVAARGLDGATTVAATMRAAEAAGIGVMATGGIGGVHRHERRPADPSFDESADLLELSRTPITVVCSGPKAILHLRATRERLESLGVPVIGYRTDTLPAFYCGSTRLPADDRADTVAELAGFVRARDEAGLPCALLVVQALPQDECIPLQDVERVVESASREASSSGVQAAEMTPYLLRAVRERLGDRALEANVSLLERNAGLAAELAVALAG